MKFEFVEQAKKYLLDKMGAAPEVAIVMGSGLSAVDEILSGPTRIHYVSIPHFPVPKVAGHRGQVVFGKVGKHQVVVFEGRVHYYEGNTHGRSHVLHARHRPAWREDSDPHECFGRDQSGFRRAGI